VLSWLVAAQVETTFTSRSLLPAYYWLGLERAGNLYYWVDGTRVNNGNVSNTNPCEHAWQPHLHCKQSQHSCIAAMSRSKTEVTMTAAGHTH
jgi:hypothetical protein